MPSSAAELLDLLTDAKVSQNVKPWGAEHVIDAGEFLLKVIRVDEGCRTSLQRHQFKDELMFILEGDGNIEAYGGHVFHSVRLPPGTVHRTEGPVLLLEVSSHHPDDVERLEDDYGR